jgi:hypothetical protein
MDIDDDDVDVASEGWPSTRYVIADGKYKS